MFQECASASTRNGSSWRLTRQFRGLPSKAKPSSAPTERGPHATPPEPCRRTGCAHVRWTKKANLSLDECVGNSKRKPASWSATPSHPHQVGHVLATLPPVHPATPGFLGWYFLARSNHFHLRGDFDSAWSVTSKYHRGKNMPGQSVSVSFLVMYILGHQASASLKNILLVPYRENSLCANLPLCPPLLRDRDHGFHVPNRYLK